MIGEKMTVTKSISELGKATRFGANWPGKRCGAKTRRGTDCQRPAYKQNGRCGLHGGQSTGAKTPEGLKRISDANLKHGKYTKDKITRDKRAAQVGTEVREKLKLLERKLIESGFLDDQYFS